MVLRLNFHMSTFTFLSPISPLDFSRLIFNLIRISDPNGWVAFEFQIELVQMVPHFIWGVTDVTCLDGWVRTDGFCVK